MTVPDCAENPCPASDGPARVPVRPRLLRAERKVAGRACLTARRANVYLEDDGSPPTKRRGLIGNTVRTTQVGTKTVAAPATVSGLPFILVAPRRHATAQRAGRQMNGTYPRARRPAVSHRSNVTGGEARNRSLS